MGLKDILLKKGWAGRTISRPETIDRINPLLPPFNALMHGYDHAITHLSDRRVADGLALLSRRLRADIGKLSEIILSSGGVAYNGTQQEPGSQNLGDDDSDMLFALLDREQAFRDLLTQESDIEHHMRSRAVIGAVIENSLARLDFLKIHTMTRRRRTSAQR